MRLRGEELPFSENVVYIFDKQIEEAGYLVINKIDLLETCEVEELKNLARQRYPDKSIFLANALVDQDVKNWLENIDVSGISMPLSPAAVDSQRYSDGQSRLAWLNDEITLNAIGADPRDLAIRLISTILKGLQAANAAIGHLKFLVTAGDIKTKLSFTALEQCDWEFVNTQHSKRKKAGGSG